MPREPAAASCGHIRQPAGGTGRQTATQRLPQPRKKDQRKLVKHRGAPHPPRYSSPLPLTSSPSFRSFPSPVTRGFWHTQPDIEATTHPHRIASHLPSFDVQSCLPLPPPLYLVYFPSLPSLYSPLYLLLSVYRRVRCFLPVCVIPHCLLLPAFHSPLFIHPKERASLSSLFTSSV